MKYVAVADIVLVYDTVIFSIAIVYALILHFCDGNKFGESGISFTLGCKKWARGLGVSKVLSCTENKKSINFLSHVDEVL